MTADHHARRHRVREQLSELAVDALYVTNLVDVRWLTGFTGTNGQVLLGADPTEDVLVTDGRYVEQAATQVDVQVTLARGQGTGIDDLVARLQRLGLQADHVTWARHRELAKRWDTVELVPTSGVVATQRQVKDAGELALLERACQITDQAWSWLPTIVAAGITERGLATALERHMVDLGAHGPSFPSIVAFGSNSARPHHRPTDRPLQAGDLAKVDFGALVDGYHADMTRVFSLGPPPRVLADVYGHVRAAQEAGVEAAVVGATTGAVDAACRTLLTEVGHGDQFVHGTGHGVGLDIHELPAVADGATATLAAGMTITVEPGVYLPGVGGVRIEDTLVVTPSGPQRLTQSSRDLVVV